MGGAASAMVLGSVVASAFAAPVQMNGSFETENVVGNYNTVSAGGTTITNWTVDTGSVDHIDDYWQASEGEQSIDLNGNEQGSVSQVLTTVVGATYTVTFDMSGNPDGGPVVKTVEASATGNTPEDFTFDTSADGGSTHVDMNWTPKQYVFVATGTSTTLMFASQDEGTFGPAIDNVIVNEDTSTVPTPTPTQDIPDECDENITYNVIEGTAGSNVLNGTNGPDLILAKGGSDVVDGKGGDDCIVGAGGSDSLKGGNGADVILGGADSDNIKGENGQDLLFGEGGSDALNGGNGADDLSGGAGSDSLKGEAGNDTLTGDGGSDAANGGIGGNDTCTAEAESQCEL